MPFSEQTLILSVYTIFRPITDAMSVTMKKIRQKVAGSLKTRMPIRTVPTAPIPVHTGYAVPIGIVLVAFARRIMLRADTTTNPAYHPKASQPAAILALPRQKVNPHSQRPATIRIIQFITN